MDAGPRATYLVKEDDQFPATLQDSELALYALSGRNGGVALPSGVYLIFRASLSFRNASAILEFQGK